MNFFHVSAFLWEDLWLELYKNIDEGLIQLEQKQYEYEMTGQGETTINEVVNPILAEEGVQCDIGSTTDIERLIWNDVDNHVEFVISRCTDGSGEPVPTRLVETVSNQMRYVRDAYSQRAVNKSQRTYEIARVWIYHDGNIENSPFDLIFDLQEIDKIIFGEELEYNGVPYEKSADEELEDFLTEDKDYLYEEDEEEDEEEEETWTGSVTGTGTVIDDPTDPTYDWDHRYICAPDTNPSWLDVSDVFDVLDDITGWTGGTYTPITHVWEYPDGDYETLDLWGGPYPATAPDGEYAWVSDSWKCSEFFCIIIEFQKSSYGLAGWESMSIAKVLSKVAEHLEKPANASLTQRKMTTNNFELGSIIKNLPDMLRGFWIEVQSKPIPILELESDDDQDVMEGDVFELENMIRAYYKNSWLDYDRRNDLDILGRSAEEIKILQTARGMPITYSEVRMQELENFSTQLVENNRIMSQAVDKEILTDSLWDFTKQFTELEKFVAAMKDFTEAIGWVVNELNKVPTRSS